MSEGMQESQSIGDDPYDIEQKLREKALQAYDYQDSDQEKVEFVHISEGPDYDQDQNEPQQPYKRITRPEDDMFHEIEALGKSSTHKQKMHYSDGELGMSDDIFYGGAEIENNLIHEKPKISPIDFDEFKSSFYAKNICMFCKKGGEPKAKSSIFDPDRSQDKVSMNSSKPDSIEIMKLYQDVSTDDMKSSFRNGFQVMRNNLELKYLTSR